MPVDTPITPTIIFIMKGARRRLNIRVFYQNNRQRRDALTRADAAMLPFENGLLGALFFVIFLYPFLQNPELLLNPAAVLWWVQSLAGIGLLMWAAVFLYSGAPLAPSQLTGASVDAMIYTVPNEELVDLSLTTPAVSWQPLPYRQTTLKSAAAKTVLQQKRWRSERQRRPLPPANAPFRHHLPPSTRSPEPFA